MVTDHESCYVCPAAGMAWVLAVVDFASLSRIPANRSSVALSMRWADTDHLSGRDEDPGITHPHRPLQGDLFIVECRELKRWPGLSLTFTTFDGRRILRHSAIAAFLSGRLPAQGVRDGKM